MPLKLSVEEAVARARADLRMGAPVLLTQGHMAAICVAAETCSATRLADLRGLVIDGLDLVITHRRADTLRARAYDGDIARIVLPADADLSWVQATADPSLDLAHPLRGPYRTRREGAADLHRLAVTLCKQARLLPAALIAVGESTAIMDQAKRAGLSEVTSEMVTGAADAAIAMHRVSGARVPTRFAQAGRVHVFRPEDGGEEHYAIEVGSPARDAPVCVSAAAVRAAPPISAPSDWSSSIMAETETSVMRTLCLARSTFPLCMTCSSPCWPATKLW